MEKELRFISINNRRFLGNKFKLLNFIKDVVKENCTDIHVFADLFAGTGSVASAFSDNCKIITNDILYSNFISHIAWFSSQEVDYDKISRMLIDFNSLKTNRRNYMSINFADTYFDKAVCSKIGVIRETIDRESKCGNLNEHERALLITSLLYAMDKIAHTCGHYDAYRQTGVYENELELCLPKVGGQNHADNEFFNLDINELAPKIEADIVYLDPPYNSRQYCDAYHLLENVARWKKPPVQGIARKMNRSSLKSAYCTSKAADAFYELVQNLHCRYILLSYNNMCKKGNDRSNAKISDDDIMRSLKERGDVSVFTTDFKAFTTGKSNIPDNQERLFLCTCR